MNTFKLSNISLDEFRDFLRFQGCICQPSQSGSGHEKWVKPGLLRPVTLQSHVSPVPEFIIKNSLRNLGLEKKHFQDYQKEKKLKSKG